MSDMVRYSVVENKNQREIVLLKGFPCCWGKCSFCDYILDNSENEKEMADFNSAVLSNIQGIYQRLEVINSGSVFELPQKTLAEIKRIADQLDLKELIFESYWGYRNHLQEIRNYFQRPVAFKCGIETFHDEFRNKVLKKGILLTGPEEAAKYFEAICLLVGIKGQTKEMIKYDMEAMLKYFQRGCVNVYQNNSTNIKADPDLIGWFYDEYAFLEDNPKVEVLWNNTDFGVGVEL